MLDAAQILQMEHSYNAGTFAGRVCASTLVAYPVIGLSLHRHAIRQVARRRRPGRAGNGHGDWFA